MSEMWQGMPLSLAAEQELLHRSCSCSLDTHPIVTNTSLSLFSLFQGHSRAREASHEDLVIDSDVIMEISWRVPK